MLDKESLIFHCEALLDQRFFLQQMKLTTLHQLRSHDARVVDSLSVLKRFLPLEQPSKHLAYIFANESQWLELLESVDQQSTSTDFLLYLAELTIALGINTSEKMITELISSESLWIFDFGIRLAIRVKWDIGKQLELNGESSLSVLKYLGYVGRPEYLEYLNDIVASFSIDDEIKNVARLSRLFLGHDEDVVSILNRFIEQEQIDQESLSVLFAKMSEEECGVGVHNLTNSTNIPSELVIFAMTASGCTQYTPFLSEFLADEYCRDSVLYGIATQNCNPLEEVIPYECFHPTREIAWSMVRACDLEEGIIHWYHTNSHRLVKRSIAGLEPTTESLQAIWQSGNSLQRGQANLYLTLRDPHLPFINPISLWGGSPL